MSENRTSKDETKSIRISLLLGLVNVIAITVAQIIGIKVLIVATLTVYLIILLMSKDEALIPLILFFLPWSAILKISPTSLSFASVGTILVFLKSINRGRVKPISMISVCGIVLITLIPKIIRGYGLSSSYFMFFVMMVAFPFIYAAVIEKTKFDVCIRFFSFGIISAAVISQIFGSYAGISQYIVLFDEEVSGVARLCGFYGDPNFYAAQIVTAFGGLLITLLYSKDNKIKNVLLLVSIMICGAISVSKSFLIFVLLTIVLWLISTAIYKPTKLLYILVGVSVIITTAVLSGVFDDLIVQYIIRFGEVDDASSLTTGRSDLWIEYLKFFRDNTFDFLFGQGYTSVFYVVHKGSHNSLIQCIYQLGCFGTLFFLIWMRSLPSRYKNSRIPFWCCAMWIVSCFGMWMGLDILFFDDLFLNVILFSIGCDYIKQRDNQIIGYGDNQNE